MGGGGRMNDEQKMESVKRQRAIIRGLSKNMKVREVRKIKGYDVTFKCRAFQ